MAPERTDWAASGYPVNLRIAGRKCLVAGGGPVAERKAASLLEAGAEVLLVSPEVTANLSSWAAAGRLRHHAKPFEKKDVQDCFLVICATDSPQVNEFAAAEAKAAGALVNVADEPELCDFILPARLRRGSLSITVSTGGRSPALARKLRDELGELYGPEYETYLEIVGRIRRELQDSCGSSSERCQRWREIGGFDPEALEMLRQGCQEKAEVRIRHVVGCLGTQS